MHTRYGAWYGDSYGDWGAMFVSFCLHYACVDTDLMPVEADCRRWTDKLGAMQNYRDRDYVPEPGDVVFFEGEKDGRSDHAGLVYEIIKDADGNPVQIITIEGNSSESVQYVQYALTDTDIAGYGKLPKNPERSESTKESKEEETVTEEKENTDNTDSDEDKVENEEAPAVLTATAENGVTVTMTAPKESLPASAEELSLRATVVEDKDAKELIEKEISE